MPALAQLSPLVATLYEAAADHAQWPRFLDGFYRAMDGTRGALTSIAPDPTLANVFLQGYTEPELRAYADYYHQHDVVLDAGIQTIQRRNEWVGPLEEIFLYRNLESTEIYNDYYCSLDMHYAACMMVGASGPYEALGLAAWRPKAAGPFGLEQLRLLELLTPHLKQAFNLHAELLTLRVAAQTFGAALDATSIAVLALRADGHILAASTPAQLLLDRREVLLRRNNRLHAVSPERDRLLQQLLSTASATGELHLGDPRGTLTTPGGSLLLSQPGKPHSLQLRVLPARSSGTLTGVALASLVFISNPGAATPTRALTLQQLYDLTPVESRLADLFLEGRELKQAATDLRLTYAAARFHLKQIFRKTNTTRQTELLRLLLSITP